MAVADDAADDLAEELKQRLPDCDYVRQLCSDLHGVPDALRAQVWPLLLGVASGRRFMLDDSIVKEALDLDNQRVILADAQRTRGELASFRTEERQALIVRLLTYYCKRSGVSYRQGLNELLAPLLVLSEPPMAEGLLFNCFYALIRKFLPHLFSDDDFNALQCSFLLLRLLLLYHDPSLCTFLDQYDLQPELYATPWLLTLFARGTPLPVVLQLWDAYLLDDNPYLHMFVILALLISHRATLLETDFVELPTVLSQLSIDDADTLQQLLARARQLQASTPRSFRRSVQTACYASALPPDSLLQRLHSLPCIEITIAELLHQWRAAGRGGGGSAGSAAGSSSSSSSEEEAMRFIVLDCRTEAESRRARLATAFPLPAQLVADAEALSDVMDSFASMRGVHFVFVGSGVAVGSTHSAAGVTVDGSAAAAAAVATAIPASPSPTKKPMARKAAGKKELPSAAERSVAGAGSGSLSSSSSSVAAGGPMPPPPPPKLPPGVVDHSLEAVGMSDGDVVRFFVMLFMQKGFPRVSMLPDGYAGIVAALGGEELEPLFIKEEPALPVAAASSSSSSSSSTSSSSGAAVARSVLSGLRSRFAWKKDTASATAAAAAAGDDASPPPPPPPPFKTGEGEEVDGGGGEDSTASAADAAAADDAAAAAAAATDSAADGEAAPPPPPAPAGEGGGAGGSGSGPGKAASIRSWLGKRVAEAKKVAAAAASAAVAVAAPLPPPPPPPPTEGTAGAGLRDGVLWMRIDSWGASEDDDLQLFTARKVFQSGKLAPCVLVVTRGYLLALRKHPTDAALAAMDFKKPLTSLKSISTRKKVAHAVIFTFRDSEKPTPFIVDDHVRCIQLVKANYRALLAGLKKGAVEEEGGDGGEEVGGEREEGGAEDEKEGDE